MHTTKPQHYPSYKLALVFAALFAAGPSWAQQAPSPASTGSPKEEENVYVLSPFEVTAEDNQTYTAANTLAGNRLSTELRDIGNAVSVITGQFLKDVQATNSETLLQYTAGTEVGSVRGNFAGLGDSAQLSETEKFQRPNQNTRVRGLAEADNTRDFFLSDIPWDGFNVDRVDLQRGPNSILFGLGSPAGLLNVGTKQAGFKNSNEVQFRVDNWGSTRVVGNFNRVLIPNELAVRLDLVREREKFQQDPAYSDNDRIHGALRWEPGFMKKGSARTILKADFENGNITSNRPRSVPPMDRITPWFATGTYSGSYNGTARTYNNLNRETFNPFQLQDDNSGRPNHGQTRPALNFPIENYPAAAPVAYNPWVGNFGDQFAGINAFYPGADASAASSYFLWESPRAFGIGPTGAIDGSLARSFHRPGGINTYDKFATSAQLPYYQYGLYKARSLIDPGVYDFYNNLIDGPNKNEWNDWNAYSASLAQTFLNDKFGFEVNIRNEEFTRGQVSMLTGDRQALYIDFNNVYTDGTPAGKNGEPWQDGTPNPNVGRPFISDSGRGGNNEFKSDRDSIRATAFLSHDFNSGGKQNLLTRILGKHTLTGLYSQDNRDTDNRNWNRYAVEDAAYNNLIGGANFAFNSNELAINRVVYLGGSLTGKSSASGARIPTSTALATVPSQITARVFDSHWNAPSVNPADPWENEYYPVGHSARASTQSENPANYVGFVNIPVKVVDANASDAMRDKLTSGVQLTKEEVTSKAIVWQGYLWDKSIVGNVGYRRDVAKSWDKTLVNNRTSDVIDGKLSPGYLDLSKAVIPATAKVSTVDVISRSYSIVAHVNQLPFIGKVFDRLPVEMTLFYNKSSNFQPKASRVDVYGERLAPPSGKTIDRGILLETKDGKYSLKVNKFITSLKDADSSALTNAYYIGDSQARGGNWANMFAYDFQSYSGATGYTMDNQTNNRPDNYANPPGFSKTFRPGNASYEPGNSLYDYGTDTGETRADADAREARAVAGWRAWQQKVDPRFYAAWGININDPTKNLVATTPQGFTVTEDSVSEGYEIEFNANPTRNWRLTLNATKTEARRSNVGGANLKAFITAYETALRTTAAGDLRIWWGGAGNDTTLRQWFQNSDSQVGADWAQKQLADGTNVAELRKWRFNAITNYNFSEGRLKGFRVGGGIRWQDKVGIGYRPVGPATASTITLDLDNPYMGPKEINLDAWVGYERRLPRKISFNQNITWEIQLNVTNIGKGNDLIPVTVQPDGSYGTYRIAPHQYWTLTNTFKF